MKTDWTKILLWVGMILLAVVAIFHAPIPTNLNYGIAGLGLVCIGSSFWLFCEEIYKERRGR